ncbi:prolipoprotein diacylglyceryltransferase [Allocatelliglobosispora scoriae]|uniref:Prolipoprotein diacylglyceryltransferase n=1 Tax=Allocatelliglobosispora scoriae TaxID=643052 RepID=A0A841BKF9_9ACTN|nr:prolipoprotein diacylglyceryl transferase family protein [Allocatelliglobosispora scoriae]MBB5867242.1 prolipoprotein diacylglyceryltransferase [Allocatelliglobosispora scoriae]
MHPLIATIGGIPIGTHDVLVGLGVVLAAIVFVMQARYQQRSTGQPVDDRIWSVVAGTLVGGALLGRLGTWAQHLDPRDNATLLEQWLYGNRSILSGLVGAYAGALIAKRLTGYREPTGDLFAPAVAAGMALGRVGCLLTELPGTPTGSWWGITLNSQDAASVGAPAGVALHPSFAYEIAFHLLALLLLLRIRGRVAKGQLLTLYLAAYAAFRFGVEFVRGNEVVLAGLTRPQLFLLAFAPLAAWRIVRQARRGAYSGLFRRPSEMEAVS